MSERPASAAEALELFLERRGRGEPVDPADFVARHPELAPELEEALEGLLALEGATQAPPERPIQERVGPFRVLRELGRGGMGVVLEAIEEPLGRRVALKVLPPELLTSASARARFRREAALAARLDHSGIATIYGAGVEGEHPWIAMRYVEGRTLAQAIADARAAGARCALLPGGAEERAPELVLAACLARVARALAAAHEVGVVHRDVKPSNVIVGESGEPVLVDFGLAIAEDQDAPSLTRTGETAGTPAYLAPENVSGERALHDAQSDVYALGVTLYECLALRRPFEAPTRAALYRAIVSGVAPDLRSANRRVPRDLAVVVSTAMERERDRRYRSAADLAADLEACAEGRPIAARPVPLAGRALRWARREPRQALLSASLLVATLFLAVLGGAWWSSRAEVRAAEAVHRERAYEEAVQDGYAEIAINWLEEAERSFARALALVPRSAEAIAGRALLRMKDGRDAEAAEVLAAAAPTPAIRALQALAAGERPEADLGSEWLGAASSIDLFLDGTRLARQAQQSPSAARPALRALALERFVEAVQRASTARMLYHVQWAFAARDAGGERAMRSAAAALLALWPDHPRSCFSAAQALGKVDPLAAIELYRRVNELEPQWGAPYQNLGNLLMDLKQYEAAEAALRRALELDPRDVHAANSLGALLHRQDRIDEAREHYHKALALRPMFETWANLGLLEEAAGRFTEAERALREALALVPEDRLLRRRLARALHGRSELDGALAEMERVARTDPSDLEAWRALALWRLEAGLLEAALEAAEAGLALAPQDEELAALAEEAARALDGSR